LARADLQLAELAHLVLTSATNANWGEASDQL